MPRVDASLYMPRSEVRALLGISNQNLGYWMRKCKIRGLRMGTGESVVHRESVRALVAEFEKSNRRRHCTHPRLIYIEQVIVETTYVFIDGKRAGEPTQREKPTKTIHVYCEDCIFDNRYRPDEVPRWVQELRK